MDACVLVPLSLCDLLLRAASDGLFRLVWSEEILNEVERALVKAEITSADKARTIVTANLKDFPAGAVRPYRIVVRSPDDFLCELFERRPNDLADIVRRQAHALINPPISVERLLDGIAKHAPGFVARLGPLLRTER